MADSISHKTVTIPGQFTVDGQPVTLNFTSPDAALIKVIDDGGIFPAGDLTLGSFSANVTIGKPVSLGNQAKSISFSFSAGTTYGLQIISSPADVLKTLNADADISADIDLATGTAIGDRFLLLKLTYNMGGTVKGTAALGTGLSVNFGAAGQLNGDWDVVHRFNGEIAAKVLDDTFDSWRLPLEFSKPSDLKPGTWLVSEISGSIDVNLGVQVGYNYSWIKQLAGGNLTGDVGLKIGLAATASLGFSANGNYALVVARPDGANKVRLSLYKLAKKGWKFALNASAGVHGVLPPALQNVSDISGLVKAIFGTQATQLINDLQTVQKVAAGGNLTDQASDYLVSLGQKELGVAADRVTAFNKAVDAIKDANNYLAQLKSLGPSAESHLLAILPPSTDKVAQAAISDMTTVLTDIKNTAGDPTKIASILNTQLQKVAFFQTGFGKWLTSVLQDAGQASPLGALKDNSALTAIGNAAMTTLNLINGTDLQTLIDYAETRLDLKNIPTLANIDSWLKSKIASFLNKAVGTVTQQDLNKVQQTVNNLFNKGNALVAEAIKAAQKQYEATFVATYESTTSNTALIDVVFDFDANPGLGPILQNAINGNFTKILIDPTIGVTLNSGVLTHGFHRQTHVEITLPFLDTGTTAATDVIDNMTVKHDGGGRVLAYTATANNDAISFVQGKSVRDSHMTLLMNLSVPAGVNKASDFAASFGYSLRAAYAMATTKQVSNMLAPLVTAYNLPLPVNDVDNFAIDLDKIAEHVPSGKIGKSLFALDVAVDSRLPGVWLQAPISKDDTKYKILSIRTQELLKALIGSVYFSQPKAYDNIVSAYKVIAYMSMQPMTGFQPDTSTDPPGIGSFTNDIYWDPWDINQVTAVLNATLTLMSPTGINANMQNAFDILTSLGDSKAQFFQPTEGNVKSLLAAAMDKATGSSLPDVLGSLVVFEHDFITSVASAATRLASFVQNAAANPVVALKVMSDFSASLVKTFNEGLGDSLVGGAELQALGSALFTEVTIALARAINVTVPSNAAPSALFSMSIAQPNANISLDDLKAGNFKPAQILVEEKLSSSLPKLVKTASVMQ